MAGGGFCDGVSLPVQMDLAVCHFLCNSRKFVLLFFSNARVDDSLFIVKTRKKRQTWLWDYTPDFIM